MNQEFGKMSQIFSLFIYVLFLSNSVVLYAAVEYSGNTDKMLQEYSPPKQMQTTNKVSSRPTSPVGLGANARSFNPLFEIQTSYEDHKIQNEFVNAKINLIRTKLEIRPIEDVFINATYWYANSSHLQLTQNPKHQKGNLTAILGLNWFNMGSELEKTRIDIHLGAMFGEKDSDLASTRLDKIVGFETTKRFNTVLFGLGVQLRLTNTPKSDKELIIGNMAKFSVGLGWIVSHDIRIGLEANSYKLYGADLELLQEDPTLKGRILEKDVSFSTLSPQLFLSLGETSLEAYLGFHIRTKNPTSKVDTTKARLFEIPGVYGNSILGGLSFVL